MGKTDRNKIITWNDPETCARDTANISGLDYLKSIKNGTLNPPPVAMLVGYKIMDVTYGHAIYELNPEEVHYNPFSSVHGGIISTLLDTTMTASVLSTLQKGTLCSTIEIKVNFTRPVTSRTGRIRCEAKVLHVGKRIATVEGKIKANDGKLYAHGLSTCSLFKDNT